MNNLNVINNKFFTKKKILIFEIIFIVGVLSYIFISTSPNSIYPLSGMTIIDNDFVFEIENGDEVLISTSEDFDNPLVLVEGDDIILSPGSYFWKVRSGFRESEIKNFTIESHVGLDIREKENNYELENSGNVDLNVTKGNETFVTGFTISIGESVEVEKDNSSYEGRQNE